MSFVESDFEDIFLQIKRVQQYAAAAATIRCGLRIKGRIGQGTPYHSISYLKYHTRCLEVICDETNGVIEVCETMVGTPHGVG